MYGQTISMYKTLVDAYRTVLERMQENNLVLPMAMIMAMVGGAAVSQKAAAAELYWAPSINTGAAPWDGAWDSNSSTNWSVTDPALTPATTPYGTQKWADVSGIDVAIFAPPPRVGATDNGPPIVGGVVPPPPYTVSVIGNVTANGLKFWGAGYVLGNPTGGTGTIVLAGVTPTITAGTADTGVGTGRDATLSCNLASAGDIIKEGDGTLILAGVNNGGSATTGYGKTIIRHGTVQLGLADATTGSATTGTVGRGDVELNHVDATLRIARTDAFTLGNKITGVGTLLQAGMGTTILTGANSHAKTNIVSGILRIKDGGTLGSGLVTNNATLQFAEGSRTVDNEITGAGDLEQISGGTTVLNADNTYAGGKTTVTSGNLRFNRRLALSGGQFWDHSHIHVMGGSVLTLALKSDDNVSNPDGFTTADLAIIGALQHSTNNVQDGGFRNGAILALDTGTNNFTHSHDGGGLGNTGGNLSLRKLGRGTLTFNGEVSYTGTTTFIANGGLIDESTLGFTSGALTGNIVRTGSADFVGNLTKSGAGTLTLSGTNSYTGVTDIAGGMLQFTNRNALYNGGFIEVGSGLDSSEEFMWTTDKIIVRGGATFALNVGGATGFTSDDLDVFNSPFFGFSGATFNNGAILGLDTTNGDFAYATGIGDTVGGSRGLTKLGANSLILTGSSSYTGDTLIAAGTLQIGDGGFTGSLATGTLTNNGTLAINRADAVTVANDIGGTGNFQQLGLGTTTLTGTNTYTGNTEVRTGTLRAGTTQAFGIDYVSPALPDTPATALGTNANMDVYTGATLDLDGHSNRVGALRGGGNVMLGAGTLTVSGARETDAEFSGTISGTGGFVLGAGATQQADIAAYAGTDDEHLTQILSGNNTYSGTTTIDYGTLRIGAGGLTGTLGTGDVFNNSDPDSFDRQGLEFNRGGEIVVNNAIHGAGTVGIAGSGTVTLAGASDYTGDTTLRAGRLNVTGSLVSDIEVDPSTHDLTTIAGQTTTVTEVQDMAILSGNGSTSGHLTLGGGSYIMGGAVGQAFRANGGVNIQSSFLWTSTTVGGGTSTWSFDSVDQVNILDGSGQTGTHTIDVLEYDNGGDFLGTFGFNAADFRGGVLNDTGSKITLTYSSADRVWNSASGRWDNLVTADWTGTDTLDGTLANQAKKFSSGDRVVFNDTGVGAGATRTVQLDDRVAPGAVLFNNNVSSYVVTGNGGIVGATSLVKDGTGTVVLDTDNSYLGTTTVNAGTLRVGNGGTRGMLGQGDVILNGAGTLLFGRTDTSSDFSETTTVAVGDSRAILINNQISGTGNVGQVGGDGNNIVLNGNNSYTGTTTVNSGSLIAGSSTAFGVNSATTVELGGFLSLGGFDIALGSLNGGGFVYMLGGQRGTTLTLGGDNTNTVFSGQMSDINRDYHYTLGLTVNDRILITDAAGNAINYRNERVSARIDDRYNPNDGNTTVAHLLADSAGYHKEINGVWVDTSGRVVDGQPGAPAEIYRGKTWQSETVGGVTTWYKVMLAPAEGAGWDNSGMAADLVKVGTGIQTLAGDNTYTGETIVNGGTLKVGNGGGLVNRDANGILTDAHGTLGQTSAVSVAGGATLAFDRADNALVWAADAWRNNSLYAGGRNQVGYFFDRPRGALVVSASISGAGTLKQVGTGTTTLTGNQANFSGDVVVENGTLRIGDAIIDTIIDLAHPAITTGNNAYKGSFGRATPHVHQGEQAYAAGEALGNGAGTNTVTVHAGGTLAFNLASDYTETHAIGGAGGVAHTGSGMVVMQGNSTYSGPTTVASTVARYAIVGGSSTLNLTHEDGIFGQDAVIGGTLRANVASTLNAANTSAVSGAFGVQSVVTVNAGATLDLNGLPQYIGALNSDTTALTDGNARVKEYLPNGEVHAGTDSSLLGTAGQAVINHYRNNALVGSNIAVGIVRLGGATLTVGDGDKSGDFAGVLTGSGTLVKIGSGTQILSGDSIGPTLNGDYAWGSIYNTEGVIGTPDAFAGDIQINGGTLQLGNGTRDALGYSHGAVGTGHISIAFGATLAFNRHDILAVTNQISGAGNVVQDGPEGSLVVLSGNNSYTGTTQVNSGILRALGSHAFGNPATAGAAVVNGGTLDLNSNGINFGSLNGGGGIVQMGTSATTALTIGRFNNTTDLYSGSIQGAGSLVKTGTGAQILAGLNTYTGETRVEGGTLRASIATIGGEDPTGGAFGVNSAMTVSAGATVDLNGYDQTLGSLAGAAGSKVTNTSLASDAVLTITGKNLNPVNFAGELSDGPLSGGIPGKKISLVKTGAGTQELSGNFSYSGDTTVNQGKLILNYAGGIATNSAKGNLFLGGAEVQFANLGNKGQSFASTTITNGNTNKLSVSGWTAGVNTGLVDLGILNYTAGALDVSNISTAPGWIKIDASQGNKSFLYNGLITANDGQNLVATDANGYLIAAATADFSQGGAVGDPAGPLVTPASAVRLTRTGFGGNVLDGTITLYNAGTTDISSLLNAFTTSGPNALNVSNPAITDVTFVIGGGKTLRLADDGAIISAAGTGLVLSGGSLTAGGADNTDGILTVNATNNITVNASIQDNGSGVVGLNKVGVGVLTIATPGGGAWDVGNAVQPDAGSTYSGVTNVTQGILRAGANNALSAYSQVAVAEGATLDLNNFNNRVGSLAGEGSVALGSGSVTVGEDGADADFSGVISSGPVSGGLTKVGSGTQILSGENTYSGTTRIYGGVLQVGNNSAGGTLGSATGTVDTGTVASHGTLAFCRSDDVTIGNSIAGAGSVRQIGDGTTTLTGNNSYIGATEVEKGTLRAGRATSLSGGGAFGTNSAVSVSLGATLDLANFNTAIGSLAGAGSVTLGTARLTVGGANASTSFSGVVSGAGGLTKIGSGTLTLAGSNTYTGSTQVSGGILRLDYSAGSNRLAPGSSLVLDGGEIVFHNLASNTQEFASTTIAQTNTATPFRLTRTGTWTTGYVDLGSLTRTAGAVDISDLTDVGTWIKASDNVLQTFSGTVTANGGQGLVMTDADGFFFLQTTADYSQGGAIASNPDDAVRLISTGAGGNLADTPVTLAGAGTTDIKYLINAYTPETKPDDDSDVELQIGAGKTLRMGVSGGITSAAGTDLLITGGTLTAGGPTANTAGSLTFNATDKITVDSVIANNGTGAVSLTKSGADTLLLLKGNTYTGATTINQGTLQVGNGGTAGSLSAATAITVNSGGTLSFNHSDADAISNVISGEGTVSQDGTGTLSLSQISGFTGKAQVNRGTLELDSATPGAIALGGGISVAQNAALRIGNAIRPTHVAIAGDSSNYGTVLVNTGSRLDVTGNIGGNGVINNFGRLTFAGGTADVPVNVQNAITNNGGASMEVSGVVNTGSIIFTQGGTLAVTSTALINAIHVPTDNTTPTAAQSGPAVVIQAGAKLKVDSTSVTQVGRSQKIIHTASNSGGVSGRFTIDSGSVSPGDGLHYFTAYTTNDVFLGLQKTIRGGTITKPTTQQTATLGGITEAGEQAVSVQNANIQAAINNLSTLTGPALADALNRLSGHDRATIDNVAIRQSHNLGQGIVRWAQSNLGVDPEAEEIAGSANRAMRATALGDVQDGVMDEENHGLRFFTRATHAIENKGRQFNGVLGSEATSNVFTLGVHNQLSSDWNIGAAFTYDTTNTTAAGGVGTSDAETFGLDAYFSHLMGEAQDWFISGAIGFGVGSYENKRTRVGPGNLTATSETDATNFHVAAMFGQRLELAKESILTPYAGLSHVRNSVDGYQESLPDAPGLALAYEDKTVESTEAIFGVDFAQGFDLGSGYSLTPSAGIAWHHQLSDGDATAVNTHFVGASGASFNTYLGTPAKDAIELLGGVALKKGPIRAFVNLRSYRSIGGSNDATQNSIGAGLSYDF